MERPTFCMPILGEEIGQSQVGRFSANPEELFPVCSEVLIPRQGRFFHLSGRDREARASFLGNSSAGTGQGNSKSASALGELLDLTALGVFGFNIS
jgi:hypothetical protein